jgi:hypothetical protein
MKKPIGKSLRALTAAALVVTQALVIAGPSAAAPPLFTRTAMKGQAVIANYFIEDGCHRTGITIFGTVNLSAGATANDQLASISFFKFDTCEQKTLLEGFGATSVLTLDVRPDLSQAAFETTITATNFIDGRTFPVVVDVDFTATAKAVKTNTNDRFESENIVFKTSSKSSERSATAAGSLLLDGEEVFAQGETSLEASIASGTERTVTIERTLTP